MGNPRGEVSRHGSKSDWACFLERWDLNLILVQQTILPATGAIPIVIGANIGTFPGGQYGPATRIL
jgi:hypothetical protein